MDKLEIKKNLKELFNNLCKFHLDIQTQFNGDNQLTISENNRVYLNLNNRIVVNRGDILI